MVKRVLTMILVAALITGIAGCSSKVSPTAQSGSPSKDTTKDVSGKIEFMTYRDDLLLSWYPDALKEFNKKYPNVTITTSTSKNFAQDLNIRMSANNVPDVVTVTGDSLSDAQRTQNFLPLDDVFPDLVKAWQYNAANTNQDDKKTYALTYGGQGIGLAYNKKIFSKLGLTPPKTLDALISAAKTIKNSGAGMIGFAGVLKVQWISQAYTLEAQALMADQQKTYADMLKSDTPFTMDSVWGQMAQIYTKLCGAGIMEDDPASMDWEPYLKLCGTGKVGMTLTWSNTPVNWPGRGDGSVALSDIGYIPFPYDNSGGPYKTIMMADWGLAISKSSKNMDAAKAFFQWHMNDKYGAYVDSNATISARKDIVTNIDYLKEFYQSSNPIIVTAEKTPAAFKTQLDKCQMTIYNEFTLIALGTPIQTEFDKMNAAWKTAKGQ